MPYTAKPMNALERNNAMLYGSGSKASTPVKKPTVVATVPRAVPATQSKVVNGYSPSFQNAYNVLNPNRPTPTPVARPAPAPVARPAPAPTPAPAPKAEPTPVANEDDPDYWYNILKGYGYKKGGAVSVKTTSRMRTTQQGKKNSKW